MDEDTEGDKMSEEDMNWEDFMNVVTTYSCKFCTFTCTAPSDMGRHVKRIHMPRKITSSPTQSDSPPGMAVVNPSLVMDPVTPSEVDDATVDASVCPSEAASAESELEGVSEVTGTIVGEVSSEGVLTPLQDLEVKGPEDEEIEDGDVAPVALAITSEANGQGRQFIIVEETPSEGTVVLPNGLNPDAEDGSGTVLTISSNSTTQASVTLPANAIQTLGLSGAVYNPNIGQYSVIAEYPVANGNQASAPVTKELFLCGQCSSGFGSIDECREHMITAHSALLAGGENGEQEASGLVSVGTQVAQKKKPGRKRKSTLPATPPKAKDPDEDDDDWEPGYDINGGRESRKKRKIRPPRALKEDYFLGRRKKKKRERRTYTEAYTLKCKLFGCHAKFKAQSALDMHVKCHNDKDFNFSCIECQEQFDLWKNLRIHLWKKHEVDCDLFECELCGSKTDTYHKLTIHKEIHSENRPYTCDICGKGFKQFSQMRNHQVIHTEHRVKEPERWYSTKQCEVCKRVFANRKCLKKHMQAVHSKEKPYVCPYCGHAASRKAMLELHVRTHTGEKPFKCDVCPYATGDHNSLRRHKMRHTGQKQYKCQYCPYSCIQAISLKTHMKNKHPGQEGIYACDTCIFRTVNKQSYQQHLLDHKNGLVPEVKPTAKQVLVQNASDVAGQAHAVVIGESQSPEAMAVEMQVQTMASGEAQISAEDLAKLSNCEGLVSGDVSAASLIYQALSAISQNPQHTQGNATQSAHILGGVQTLIKSSSTEQGVTTHTITFHVPAGGGGGEGGEGAEEEGMEATEQVYFEQPMEVIEALQRASSQQAELIDGSQGNLPTVITMEASEAELEGMNLNLVPVTTSEGTILVQQHTASIES
ncbi:zinc finger Y-chromosomal protein 1-like [Haliotis rufescens]|uniref:zinc finger Y-chromosomal protein 1-like n=1 Tax=Haliotis rufescens TaxID=6454 RepID=UPI00201ED681|nr:zinc finger Y-chromosomal protein 1-like [Haliotis rufescens]XP_046354553.2 zinc finger Y-chromosomal protein 1-like [Haliotis rufescens]